MYRVVSQYMNWLRKAISTGLLTAEDIRAADRDLGIPYVSSLNTKAQCKEHQGVAIAYSQERAGSPFSPGDIVHLKTGTAPIRVKAVYQEGRKWVLDGEYVHSDNTVMCRNQSNFVYHDENPESEEEELPMTTTLYQTTEETPRFGTKLATNSAGKVVLEMKGTGDVEAFDAETIEEVLPYTVAVKPVDEGRNAKVAHYVTVKDAVVKGDLLITSEGFFVEVTELNTKRRNHGGDLKGRKLASVAI